MSIFLRKKLSENFTHLPNSLIRDPNLSWKATGFLVYLLSCADGWQLNFADLSKRKKDGEAATRAAASELKVAGYLLINKIRDEKGRIVAHEWIVSQEPEFQNPDVENPDVDFPHLENRGQRKNNSKSNSFNNKQPQQNCGGDFIYDTEIHPSLHENMRKTLVGVDAQIAQLYLDTIAEMGDAVGNQLGFLTHLVKNPDKADVTLGAKRAERRAKAEHTKRTVAASAASEPDRDPDAAARGAAFFKNAPVVRFGKVS
jgi:hypothetical protein